MECIIDKGGYDGCLELERDELADKMVWILDEYDKAKKEYLEILGNYVCNLEGSCYGTQNGWSIGGFG